MVGRAGATAGLSPREAAPGRRRPSAARRAAQLLALALGVLALGACTSADEYTADADSEVGELLGAARQATLAGRETWVQHPLPSAEPPAPSTEPAAPGADAAPPAPAETAPDAAPAGAAALVLDLRTSLHTAVTHGREFLNQRESVYQQGLSLALVRYNFGPLLDSTISYLWSDAENAADRKTLAATLGATQVLPTGGSFGIAALLNAHGGAVGADNYDSAFNLSLSQPLLRGAGYEVSHEELTQAEREMVYAVRGFELFREDFAISIADSYFDLVSRRARLANLEQSWKDAQFDRNKAEALRQVDRNRDEDVFLARRRVINAESDLLAARTDYDAAVDDFKIRIGLPTSTVVSIAEEQPPYLPVALDEDSAVEVALHNRLDLITADERLQDAERSVRNAKNGLLPDLGLNVAYGTLGAASSLGNGAVPDDWTATAGVTLALPLQRQAERNAWRNALIALDRTRRDTTLQKENVERDIVNQLRELLQVDQQIELQTQQITQEQRAVAVTEIRYEAGDVENRDLLDARQSLVDAQNALIDLMARHFIARLRLLRNLGVLFIDDQGMWKE